VLHKTEVGVPCIVYDKSIIREIRGDFKLIHMLVIVHVLLYITRHRLRIGSKPGGRELKIWHAPCHVRHMMNAQAAVTGK
jgi:Fe-S oxidoreductase